jgi:septum formation protein
MIFHHPGGKLMSLILASSSPRRRELLTMLGLHFTVRTADIDETFDPAQPPEDEVLRVARAKAAAVGGAEDEVVIAADTIVVLDGRVLGKPKDEDEAFAMLSALSGRSHIVYTGVSVRRGKQEAGRVVRSDVTFRDCTPDELRAYIASGEPMDKAGAYGAQGLASIFVERIDGDFYNVMGLPLCALSQLLSRFGVTIL